MPKCVMCQEDVTGFYDYKGEKIPVCFEHYEDGTFANYLATQHSVQRTECICVDFINCNPDPVPNPDCLIHGALRR